MPAPGFDIGILLEQQQIQVGRFFTAIVEPETIVLRLRQSGIQREHP